MPLLPTGVLIQRSTSDKEPFIFDATIESGFTSQAEITSNPVETNDGDVTDHRRTKPTVWRSRSILVNEADPAKAVDRSMAANGSDKDALASARQNGPQLDQTRALGKLSELQAMFSKKDTVTVTTDLDILENAVLESLEYRVLASEFDSISTTMVPSAIEVSCVWRQLRFATTKTVELPAESVKKQTGSKKTRGTVQGKSSNDEIKQKSRSILDGLLGGGLD